MSHTNIRTGTLGCGVISVDCSGFKSRSKDGVAEATDVLCQQGCFFGTCTQMTGVYTCYINPVVLTTHLMSLDILIFTMYISLPDDCPLRHVL